MKRVVVIPALERIKFRGNHDAVPFNRHSPDDPRFVRRQGSASRWCWRRPGLSYQPQDFVEQAPRHRNLGHLERDVLMDGEERWAGTATELLALLEPYAPEGARFSRSWPKAPNALSQRLRRAAPSLRKLGIEMADYRESHRDRRRCWQIMRTPPQKTVRTVRTVRRNEESIDLEGSPGNGAGRSSDDPASSLDRSIPQKTDSSDGLDGSDDDFGDPNTWGLDND